MSTEDLRRALTAELTDLEELERPRLLRALGEVSSGDAADMAERAAYELDLAQLELRIGRVRARLDALTTPGNAADAGVPVVLDFGDGPEESFLGEYAPPGWSLVTPGSPLGRALVGAAPGQVVVYATPRGRAQVTVVSVGAPDEPEPLAGPAAA